MIPKTIDEVQWNDLLALQESGREEGQQLEYKTYFKGGPDFLNLSEQRRQNAVDALAREVIAFLNASGGDIIVGAREVSNEDPRIAELIELPNVQAVSERLNQALSAVIEPAQALVTVRAIRAGDADAGALLIRAGASLRSPHRSIRTREAYVRRGRETAPMAMDEVQDMTLQRDRLRTEKLEFIDRHFDELTARRIGRSYLPDRRFHIRAVMIPLTDIQLQLDRQLLAAANPNDPLITAGGKPERNSVAFRSLRANWQPVLRGMRLEQFTERRFGDDDFSYAARELKENGTLTSEFACYAELGRREPFRGVHAAWLTGFAANVLVAVKNLNDVIPDLNDFILRVCIYCSEDMQIEFGTNELFAERRVWPSGKLCLPDMSVVDVVNIDEAFVRMQEDFAAIVGLTEDQPFHFHFDE